jgi:hypothetical protein
MEVRSHEAAARITKKTSPAPAPLKGVRRPFLPDGAAYTRPANRRGSVTAYSELVVKTKGYKAGTPAKSIYLPG